MKPACRSVIGKSVSIPPFTVFAVTSAFAFGIYARSAASFRAQSRVSEAQQTLRSASYVLLRDLRQAGDESRIGLALQGPASPAVLRKLAGKASDRARLAAFGSTRHRSRRAENDPNLVALVAA